MAPREKLKVGQVVWFVPYARTEAARELTVEKVGTKWAQLGRYRADATTWEMDGGNYRIPGVLHADRGLWQAERDRQAAWEVLEKRVRDIRSAPAGATTANILAAFQLLFRSTTP